MYRVWRNGKPDHLEASFSYLPNAERIDKRSANGEWIPYRINGKWVWEIGAENKESGN